MQFSAQKYYPKQVGKTGKIDQGIAGKIILIPSYWSVS